MEAEAAERWELEFHPPSWYVPKMRRPGKLCFFHYRYCETVERDLDILNRVSRKKKKMKMQKKKEMKKRSIKIYEYSLELDMEKQMTEEEKKRNVEEWKKTMETHDEFREEMEMNEEFMTMECELPAPVEWTIKKGEKFKITDLLSSSKRDYLIKNNGDKVKVKELRRKHVVLYFWWLTHDEIYERFSNHNFFIDDLKDMYKAYNHMGKFEVVFVALGKNNDVFNVAFSNMPWLAIPHKDEKARNLLREKFAIPFPTCARAVLFDPNGIVLLEDCSYEFRVYGPEGFPFTKEKKRHMEREGRALWDEIVVRKHSPSLKTLLGDYLISSKGDQVSTTSLEGKIVGLYFFEPSEIEMTRELLNIWEKAKDRMYEDFEIVFINYVTFNLPMAKQKFEDEFKCSIPWYSLPVDGRKLSNVFQPGCLYNTSLGLHSAGHFIILKADWYQPISYFAYDILVEFGIDGYPFVLEKAVMLEKIKQQEKLVLGELLSPSAPLRKGCFSRFKEEEEEDTSVSKLLGKRVLLFFATHSCYKSGLFLKDLEKIYLEKKGTWDDFEIIYISLDCAESPTPFQEMPWLVHSYVPDFAASLAEKVFKFPFHLPAIAAFGPNGHLVTKESNLAFKQEWNSMYPFIKADMCKEVHRDLLISHKWDLDKLEEYQDDMYSLSGDS